jgi:hypothetical protein
MNFIPVEQEMNTKKSPNLSSSTNLTIEMEEARKKLSFLLTEEHHRTLDNMEKKAHLTLNTSLPITRPGIQSATSIKKAHFTFDEKNNKPLVFPMAISLLRKSNFNNSCVIDKLDLSPPLLTSKVPLSKSIFSKKDGENALYHEEYTQVHEKWLQIKDNLELNKAERISKIGKISEKQLTKMDKLYASHYLVKEAYQDLIRVNYIPDGTLHIEQHQIYNNNKTSDISISTSSITNKNNLSQEIFQKGSTIKRIRSNIDDNLPGNISGYGQDIVHIGKESLLNNSSVLEIELRDGHGIPNLGTNIATSSIQNILNIRQEQDSRNKIVDALEKNNLEFVREKTKEDYKAIQAKLLQDIPKKGAGSTSISCQLYNLNNKRKIGIFANLGDSEIFALIFKPNKYKAKIMMLSEAHNADNDTEAQRILESLGETNFKQLACPIYGRGGVKTHQYDNVITCLKQTNAPLNGRNSEWEYNDKVPIYDIVNNKVFRNLQRAYAFSSGIGNFAKINGYNLNFCAGFQSMRRSTLISKKITSKGEEEIAFGQLSQHLGNNFAGTLNGYGQCSRSFHDLEEQPRGSIAIPYCSVYEFDPRDHIIIISYSDGFGDMHYISQIANIVDTLYQQKNSMWENISAQILTETLWDNMISEAKKDGHSFENEVPTWDDISLAVINSPPLEYVSW